MSIKSRKPDTEIPAADGLLIRTSLSARVTRRLLLKASLIGVSGLATVAGGLVQLEPLIAAPRLGHWRRLTPKNTPTAHDGVMVYDAARRRTVLFSWESGVSSVELAATWTWDGITWTRQSPPLNPAPRQGANFAYHPPMKTAVLFGGMNTTGFLGDTWLWNGLTWTQASGGPPPRSSASMAFDPITNSIILFGGFGDVVYGDTWKWDGKSWRELSPGKHPLLTGLRGASMAYSAALGKLIMLGGSEFYGAAGSSDAIWAWDGSNWSQVTFDPSPPGRKGGIAMASDPEGRLILLFDGKDTWIFTGTWSQDTQTPAPSRGGALAPDPSGKSFVLFAVGSRSNPLGETWVWGPF